MSFLPSNPTSHGLWLPDDAATLGAILRGETAPSEPTSPPPDEELDPPTHWAAVDGSGDGSSDTSPFRTSDFWAVAQPGDVLGVLDGVYTGTVNLLQPPNGLSGADGARITVKAVNDGAVRFDSQGSSNGPVRLNEGNNWWRLQGFDATGPSASHAVKVRSAQQVVLRKIVAWDVDAAQSSSVVSVSTGESGAQLCRDILLEDCAAFGHGRRCFNVSQGGTDTVILRRCWHRGDVFKGCQIGYQAYRHIAENMIGSWNYMGLSDIERRAPLTIGRIDHFDDINNESQYLGSIATILDPEDNSGNLQSMVDVMNETGGNIIRDVVLYIEGDQCRRFAALRSPFDSADNIPQYYENITQIGDPPDTNTVGSSWNLDNVVTSTTVAGAPSPWGHAGAGARVAFRTVNGVLTDIPLWPWPMDARIRAALIAAGRSPDVIFRGAGNSVTQLMESIFGTIPAEFRND